MRRQAKIRKTTSNKSSDLSANRTINQSNKKRIQFTCYNSPGHDFLHHAITTESPQSHHGVTLCCRAELWHNWKNTARLATAQPRPSHGQITTFQSVENKLSVSLLC